MLGFIENLMKVRVPESPVIWVDFADEIKNTERSEVTVQIIDAIYAYLRENEYTVSVYGLRWKLASVFPSYELKTEIRASCYTYKRKSFLWLFSHMVNVPAPGSDTRIEVSIEPPCERSM